MNKKIIILTSFLSIFGISRVSYGLISKDNPQNNSRYVRHVHRPKKIIFLWIIFGIIVFIWIEIIALFITKKNDDSNQENETEIGSDSNSKNLTTAPEINKQNGCDNQYQDDKEFCLDDPNNKKIIIDKIAEIEEENCPEYNNQYDDWQCGVVIQDNRMQLVLCEQWDANAFVKQIFNLDVESKINLENEKLKKIYSHANFGEIKNEIINSISLLTEIVKYVRIPFLREIISMPFQTNDNDIDELLLIITNFDQEIQKEHLDKQIILREDNIKKNDKAYSKVTEECSNDFNNENSWELFKTIMNKDKPVSYEGDHLFEYCYQFYQLIKPIKEYFYNLVEECQKEHRKALLEDKINKHFKNNIQYCYNVLYNIFVRIDI